MPEYCDVITSYSIHYTKLYEGQYDGAGVGMYLVEDMQDVPNLPVHNPENISFVTQTTLSVDETKGVIGALREQFPAIQGPRKDDICYATQNRSYNFV